MIPLIDLSRQRFGRLVAVEYIKARQKWRCLCDCGTEHFATGPLLRQGRTLSCGCLRRENAYKRFQGRKWLNRKRTHTKGETETSEYKAWSNMWSRCRNPNGPRWKHYGGRGISVCEQWQDYINFLADMGRRPSARHSLDRINNDGDYEPGNCRWATPEEQSSNRRKWR